MTSSTDTPNRAGVSSREPGRLPRLYMAFWGLMAGFALLYLTTLAISPQLADQIVARRTEGAGEERRAQRSTTPVAVEIEALRRTTISLEREMEALRADLSRRDAHTSAILARLAAIETQPRATEAGETTAPVQRAAAAGASDSQILKGANTQGTVEERQPQARARAGDARPTTEARATTSDARSATPVGVHVASGPSVDSLKLTWRLLQDGHKATLKSLEPRWVEIPGNPTVYALVAGPVGRADEAGKICDRLLAKRVSCTVVTFNGQPL